MWIYNTKKFINFKTINFQNQDMSPKSDVYSFGVLLIQLVNGSKMKYFTFMVLSNGQKQFMCKKMDFKKFPML